MVLTAHHLDRDASLSWDGEGFVGDADLVAEATLAAEIGQLVPLPGLEDVEAGFKDPQGRWAALWWACRGRAHFEQPFPVVSP